MEVSEVYSIVKNYFGEKCRMMEIKTICGEPVVFSILYDSFLLRCSIDERYKYVGIGLCVGPDACIPSYLGKKPALAGSEKELIEGLSIIDDYCHLRLPDELLSS